ncbi:MULTISPECIES: bifunctional pyr operon transcriptional regulator/uracil phosphoribosyltransferase PyrR [Thiorhodovibrio]|uniref:bifunctional pyr operon transcriptional regulator/uracil phosphoribosyltransferase PyrR n=1 Tax=Thiorhodovibrio TaxID=61593 RepID=UPI0019119801|nr:MULTISPECIES: bifunctional pyr operon transcriptional regulator/uracil phosphoribosyltransferase PyrR [Thiorhodovibrio]MBK5967762.1 bifunctional pyr operon transcriptional regulator/uracil phosphoribosyltransferase [Thiorhodovibrio winogradskyi]WPL14433.1 Bifunctional protein PyrR [Thiorhodovibrio litoralis]
MADAATWKDAAEIDALLATMAQELAALCQARGIERPLMVGIHTGGVWVAEHLHRLLALEDPLGFLDISFYRDDFTRIGLHPQVHPSELPVAVDDRAVILVDDVLQSGRTIRAALNVLFDYGRPSQVLLAILAERDGRELPINPDVVGLHAELEPGSHIKLSGPDPLHLERRGAAPGNADQP